MKRRQGKELVERIEELEIEMKLLKIKMEKAETRGRRVEIACMVCTTLIAIVEFVIAHTTKLF